jgi:hypothetical protein
LSAPRNIAISGGHLFVSNNGDGTIGEYDAVTGAPINTPFNSDFFAPRGIAFLGGNLLVADVVNNQIGELDSSGAPINLSFIFSGLDGPEEIVVVPTSVPDASSTWALLLLAFAPMFTCSVRRIAGQK